MNPNNLWTVIVKEWYRNETYIMFPAQKSECEVFILCLSDAGPQSIQAGCSPLPLPLLTFRRTVDQH